MDWAQLAGQVAAAGASTLGTILGGAAGGPAGAALGAQAGKIIAGALGVEATPEAVSRAISANPEVAAVQLKVVESDNAQELALLQAALSDTQSARDQTVALAKENSNIAWGAPIVSAVVLLTFAVVMASVIWRGVPAGDSTVVVGLVETLKVLSVSVVGYWVGSSSGSKRSSDTIRNIAERSTANTK